MGSPVVRSTQDRAAGRRPTMADIARRAGVSRTAVSYALNGQPGVAADTRRHVLEIAAELGFAANVAARVMHGAATGTVGMVMSRPTGSLSIEAFRRQFISGIESELQERGYALLIHFVPDLDAEIRAYEQWWLQRSVDGFLVSSLRADDLRVEAIERIQAPAVLVGGPAPGLTLPNLWTDDAAAITEAVEHLAGLGHRRITRVSGPPGMLHVQMRSDAFDAACRRLGIADTAETVAGGYTRHEGQQVTRRLISSANPPTAIIYDNDVTALAALAVASEMGVSVPRDLSLVGWEDSLICEVVRPALTVLRRDVVAYGRLAAGMLVDTINGLDVGTVQGETPRLKVRSSTSTAP
jgi:DNA-binding LacI/PurR family transcriptional regulator